MIDLQDWLERRWENPLDAIRPTLDSMNEDIRKKSLADLWDVMEKGPPRWGMEDGMKMLSTVEGIAETFRVILRTHQPEMTFGELREVAEATTAEEYRLMLAAWWKHDPMDELEWMLGMDRSDKGNTIGWPQAVCELCETYGWTLDYAETLTLGQIKAARAGGKPREQGRGIAVAPKTNLREVVRQMRARRNGTGGKGGSNGG